MAYVCGACGAVLSDLDLPDEDICPDEKCPECGSVDIITGDEWDSRLEDEAP